MEVHGNENESNLSVISELTDLTNSIGNASNINLGNSVSRLQVLPYARDTINNETRELRCDANGRLECSVDALEVTAQTINLSTDNLETLIGTTNTKLNGGLPAALTGSGNIKVSIEEQTSTSLPTGAATSALQNTLNTKIDGIDTVLDNILIDTGVIKGDTTSLDSKVTACNTGAVVISSSVLPTGAATEAKQDVIETTLTAIETDIAALEVLQTSIDNKLPSLTGSGNLKVSIEEQTSTSLPTGASTSALQNTLNSKIDTIDGVLDNILVDTGVIKGDTTSLDSKVTACNTGAVVISSSVLPTGAATEAKQDVIETTLTAIETDIAALEVLQTSIDNKLPSLTGSGNIKVSIEEQTSTSLPTGAATSALQNSLNSKIDTIDGVLDTISANTSSNLTKLDVIKDDTTSLDSKVTACNTGDVTIGSSVLPTGAATSALQGGGLPAALTGSGNLKVSLEEGTLTSNDTTTHNKLDTIDGVLDNLLVDTGVIKGDTTSIDGKLPAALTGSGNLKVSVEEGSITSTSSDTTTHGKLDTVITAVQLLDDVVGTEDSATPTKSNLVGGRYDATPRSLDDGDIGAISVTSAGDIMTDQYHQTESTITLRNNVTVNAGDITATAIDLGNNLKNKHITIYGSTTTAAAKFYIQFGPTTTVADHYIVDATESILKQKASSGVYHYVMSLRDVPERYVSVYCDVTGAAVHQFAVVSR